MVFDVTQLKKIRKQLNLTQYEFAIKAGISQSMVAKIEANKLDPTYSNVKKIENALESLTKHYEKEAKDIMIKNIILIDKDEKITNTIRLMNKHAISQLPVLDNDKLVGLISETSILKSNLQDKNLKVKDVMEESPPIIDKNAKLEVIKQLLKFYPLILVKEKGDLIGLITKADVISNLI